MQPLLLQVQLAIQGQQGRHRLLRGPQGTPVQRGLNPLLPDPQATLAPLAQPQPSLALPAILAQLEHNLR